MSLLELISEGSVGLFKAAEKYDGGGDCWAVWAYP